MGDKPGVRADLEDEALGVAVLTKVFAEAGIERLNAGSRAPMPQEDEMRRSFTQQVAPKLDRGDGQELQRAEQLYQTVRTRQLSNKITQRRASMLEVQRYRELIRLDEQFSRLYPDYQPQLQGGLGRFRQNVVFTRATTMATVLAAKNERQYIADTEAQALMEGSVHMNRFETLRTWSTLSIAAWLSWRGRRTFRFPFYSPKFTSRLNPITSPRLRYPWHIARFMAYRLATGLFMNVVFSPIATVDQLNLLHDPRLGDLAKGFNSSPSTAQASNKPEFSTSLPPEASLESRSSVSDITIRDTVQDTKKPQDSSHAPSYETPKSRGWDAPLDDGDDASPVNTTVRDQHNSYGTAGSAWSRVRQQSGSLSKQPQQKQYGSQEGQQSSLGSDAGISPEYRGRRESYSFTSAEEEDASPRNQEQREFDKLLDQERKGVDQERTSWSKK